MWRLFFHRTGTTSPTRAPSPLMGLLRGWPGLSSPTPSQCPPPLSPGCSSCATMAPPVPGWPTTAGALLALDQGACGSQQLLLISFNSLLQNLPFDSVLTQCLYIVGSCLKYGYCAFFVK